MYEECNAEERTARRVGRRAMMERGGCGRVEQRFGMGERTGLREGRGGSVVFCKAKMLLPVVRLKLSQRFPTR